jgi:hypothetical protein
MQANGIAIMDAVVDVEETREPFGKRWAQEKLTLTSEHLDARRAGKLLAVDVHAEYVVFLELDK